MCYTVANKKSDKEFTARYNKGIKKELLKAEQVRLAMYLSGFAYPKMHIIKSENPELIESANWGLVPSFITKEVKAKEIASMTLNAKSETIFEKVSFKKSIMPRRCLIPVTGFYEWRDVNKIKYPYFIHLKQEEIFSLGGIYDEWTNEETGEIKTTFSIVTTEANPLMAKIHNLKLRMPLIFTKETENDWLIQDLKPEEIIELMQPLNEKYMTAHTIKKVSPKNLDVYSEEIINEFEYPELKLLDAV